MKITVIDAEQLKAKLKKGSSCKIINVLASDVYKDCHIPGSINIPVANIEKELSKWDKNTEIVVYCAHNQCPASANAYEILKKMGFTNVAAYEGGMREWMQKGLDKEGSCVLDYLKK